MNILRIISSVNPTGGGPIEGIKQIQKLLLLRQVNVEIVCMDDSNSPWIADFSLCRVHALGSTGANYKYSPALIPWLRANAKRFDVIIIHGLWQYHGIAVWKALKGTEIPYFVFTHGMLDPWFKKKYPLKHLKKWLYWLWAEYRVLRDAAAVIFTCEEERLLARESFRLYSCTEAVTAYGTSSPPSDREGLREHFLARHPHLRNQRLLLFLSRIHQKKGCDMLIEAFAQAAGSEPSLHLVMAGPDQTGWIATLKQQAARLGIADRITWPGMLQGDDKWGAYYAAEVFCLPSHQENFGIVVAEALACGKPVLISNKVNIWREIQADGAGIVQDDTVKGTAHALHQWLALSPQARKTMDQAALVCFDSRFRIDRVAESLIRIVRNHAPAKGGQTPGSTVKDVA
ncbi:MAG: glycosyltransferase [Polaromonas sp.]|nr:glycosyltransferase [Polaromonas sp.]